MRPHIPRSDDELILRVGWNELLYMTHKNDDEDNIVRDDEYYKNMIVSKCDPKQLGEFLLRDKNGNY